MSVLAAVLAKVIHLPAFRLGKWPRLELSRSMVDVGEAYGRAIAVTYTVAFGLDRESSNRH
jgi:hypothetical protein